MRHIQKRLRCLGEFLVFQLVDKQRQNDRQREGQQIRHRNAHGVDEQTAEVIVREERLEPFEADKLAAKNASGGLVVDERDVQTEHRPEFKDGIVDQHRNKHRIDHAVALQIFFDAVAQGHMLRA